MKEYKYKINGNTYNVAIGDIEDNVAQVEVNGVAYRVELPEKKAAAVAAVKAPRPSAAPHRHRRKSNLQTVGCLRRRQESRQSSPARHRALYPR